MARAPNEDDRARPSGGELASASQEKRAAARRRTPANTADLMGTGYRPGAWTYAAPGGPASPPLPHPMSLADLVKPESVKSEGHLWDTFGHTETEISALCIVRFLQEERPGQGWAPFPMADLQSYYERGRGRPETFLFNRLISQGHIAVQDGTVTVSPSFVSALCGNPALIR